MAKKYNHVHAKPVAKFFYKGRSHSHPVRRTVLIVGTTRTHLWGYELREGSTTRSYEKAPIKKYSKSKVATVEQLDTRNPLRKNAAKSRLSEKTFQRFSATEALKIGI